MMLKASLAPPPMILASTAARSIFAGTSHDKRAGTKAAITRAICVRK